MSVVVASLCPHYCRLSGQEVTGAVLNGSHRRGNCSKVGNLLESQQGWGWGILSFEVEVKSTFSVELLVFHLSQDLPPDGFAMLLELQLCTPSCKTGFSF